MSAALASYDAALAALEERLRSDGASSAAAAAAATTPSPSAAAARRLLSSPASSFAEEKRRLRDVVQRGTAASDRNSAGGDMLAELSREVERLTVAVAALHEERAHLEATWAERLRALRSEIVDRDAIIAAQDERERQQADELRTLRTAGDAANAAALRRGEEQRADLQRRIAFLVDEATDRERLLAAQDAAMADLEVRLDAAAGAAREWGKQAAAAGRARDVSVKACADATRSVVRVARELLRLFIGAGGGQAHDGGASGATAVLDAALTSAAAAADDAPPDAAAAMLEPAFDAFAAAVVAASEREEAAREEVARRSVELHSRIASLEAELEASRCAAEQRHAESTAASADRGALRDRCCALEQRVAEQRAELEQLGAALASAQRDSAEGGAEHHRARLAVNELRAQVTRLTAQLRLAEEHAATTAAEHGGALQHRDSTIAKLRASLKELREEQLRDRAEIRRLADHCASLSRGSRHTTADGDDSLVIVEEVDVSSPPNHARATPPVGTLEGHRTARREQRDAATHQRARLVNAADGADRAQLEADNRRLESRLAAMRAELQESRVRQQQLLREKRMAEAVGIADGGHRSLPQRH